MRSTRAGMKDKLLLLLEARARDGAPAPTYADIASALGLSDPGGFIRSLLVTLERQKEIAIDKKNRTCLRYYVARVDAWTGWSLRRGTVRAAPAPEGEAPPPRPLSTREEKILARIREAVEKGEPAPSYHTLTELVTCSQPSVAAAISALASLGHIEMEKQRGNSLRYGVGGKWTEWSATGHPEARGGQKRPCLTCGTPFPSEGIHNRLCDSCKRGASNASPLLTAEYGVRA